MNIMADEIDLDVLDEEINKNNRVEERIKDLSQKVKLTSEERDELKTLNETVTKERDDLRAENQFLSSFSDIATKYPEASEYRDAIKEKVGAGYDPMDAAVAVLAKEGKFSQPNAEPESAPAQPEVGGVQAAPIVPESPAGGSSSNPPPTGGAKPVGEMSIEEKREALMKAEAAGDISV